MPKVRQTCTRCSMRRQRCDKQEPCSRCVRANEAHSCSRLWSGGYQPDIHRAYPRADRVMHRVERQRHTSDSPAIFSERGESQTTSRPNGSPVVAPQDDATPTSSPAHTLSARSTTPAVSMRQREIDYLQSLLPTRRQMIRLVDYHEENLLWLHGCVHGPSFKSELLGALQAGGDSIQLELVDLRWASLLFAVLTASIVCVSNLSEQDWDIGIQRKSVLAKQWHQAALDALRLGDYICKPHVNSIQSILVLALVAQGLGFSSQQFHLSGLAFRLAQCLGLQRLPHTPEGVHSSPALDAGLSRMRNEIGRRIFANLCIHDWFCAPFTGMISLNPRHFSTPRPSDQISMTGSEIDLHTLLVGRYMNTLLDVGTLMVEFQNLDIDCIDVETKYELVLKYDRKLRALQIEPNLNWQPQHEWIQWANSVTRVIYAHKCLTIHRHFLSRSFTDPTFAYTRWASIEASRTILSALKISAADTRRPYVWHDQAHLVFAGITLGIDAMYRTEAEPEYSQHWGLVNETLTLLNDDNDNKLARRGKSLLASLLQEGAKNPALTDLLRKDKHPPVAGANNVAWPLESPEAIKAMAQTKETQGHETWGSGSHLASENPVPETDKAPTAVQDLLDFTRSGFTGDSFAWPTSHDSSDAFDPFSWDKLLSEFYPMQ